MVNDERLENGERRSSFKNGIHVQKQHSPHIILHVHSNVLYKLITRDVYVDYMYISTCSVHRHTVDVKKITKYFLECSSNQLSIDKQT